jgi:hypothetical protein
MRVQPGEERSWVGSGPLWVDQPFLPNNWRHNYFQNPQCQPDASHSLPMCGMNASRAPCGFFCWSHAREMPTCDMQMAAISSANRPPAGEDWSGSAARFGSA